MIQPFVRFDDGTIVNLSNMLVYTEHGEFESDDYEVQITFAGESTPRKWQGDNARILRSHMVILVNAYHAMQREIVPGNQPPPLIVPGSMLGNQRH